MTRRVVAIIAAAIALIFVIAYVIGIRAYVITSDSMAPKYSTNSLTLLNSRARAEEIQVDDVVGVRVGTSLVFHRVGKIDDEEHTALLYGDWDGIEKGQEVKLDNSVLLGKEILTIPYVGGWIEPLRGNAGATWVVAGVIIVLLLFPWEKVKALRSRHTQKSVEET